MVSKRRQRKRKAAQDKKLSDGVLTQEELPFGFEEDEEDVAKSNPEAKDSVPLDTDKVEKVQAEPVSSEDDLTADKEECDLAAQLKATEAKRDEYLALAQKTQAELENYRKRVTRDMALMKRESLGDFLKDFFNGFDDMDRAIKEGEKKNSYDAFHDGIKLVRDNLWRVMVKVGIKEIVALDKKFDPNLHEAMTTMPSEDHEPNTVLEVFQSGYMLDDFVLRPSRVIVSCVPPKT